MNSDDCIHSHELLCDLLDTLQLEAKYGLHPKGHADCYWRDHDDSGFATGYPAEYTGALEYLRGGEYTDQESLEYLAGLVFKIRAEVAGGTPLVSDMRGGYDWSLRGIGQ